ncbi:MAG TPA: hypothetical protein VG269_23490 [Tepidisphaeraceae bacterium]|nr:hypothetical protein [Tepidisphaeraceae bacterium]
MVEVRYPAIHRGKHAGPLSPGVAPLLLSRRVVRRPAAGCKEARRRATPRTFSARRLFVVMLREGAAR